MPDVPARDWRRDYLICEHLADGTAGLASTRVVGQRACCAACYEIQDDGVSTLLYSVEIVVEERDGLKIMRPMP